MRLVLALATLLFRLLACRAFLCPVGRMVKTHATGKSQMFAKNDPYSSILNASPDAAPPEPSVSSSPASENPFNQFFRNAMGKSAATTSPVETTTFHQPPPPEFDAATNAKEKFGIFHDNFSRMTSDLSESPDKLSSFAKGVIPAKGAKVSAAVAGGFLNGPELRDWLVHLFSDYGAWILAGIACIVALMERNAGLEEAKSEVLVNGVAEVDSKKAGAVSETKLKQLQKEQEMVRKELEQLDDENARLRQLLEKSSAVTDADSDVGEIISNDTDDRDGPIDLSIPYDAAAKLAYESTDKTMAYDDFKLEYEAGAVADVISKQCRKGTKEAEPKKKKVTKAIKGDKKTAVKKTKKKTAKKAKKAVEKDTADKEVLATKVMEPEVAAKKKTKKTAKTTKKKTAKKAVEKDTVDKEVLATKAMEPEVAAKKKTKEAAKQTRKKTARKAKKSVETDTVNNEVVAEKVAASKSVKKAAEKTAKKKSASDDSSENPWRSLSESTLKRKTVKQLSEYLSERGVVVKDADGKNLPKASLVSAVKSL